jgi:hypothetical protein
MIEAVAPVAAAEVVDGAVALAGTDILVGRRFSDFEKESGVVKHREYV